MSRRFYVFVRLIVILTYLIFIITWDKYIFESVLLAQTWITATSMYWSNPRYNKMFDLQETISMSSSDIVKSSPVILIWTPWFGVVKLNPYECPGCVLTYDQDAIEKASAVIFHCVETRDDATSLPWKRRMKRQRWVWLCMEPPWNVRYVFRKTLTPLNGIFNWTMTYRTDSDLIASYDSPLKLLNKTVAEIIQGKTANALGVWISSNCHATRRYNFINEISRYMPIHQFGKCPGVPLCRGECERETLKKYKFFFALENSLCKDYISEKFWNKALLNHVVPVVMGPPRREYELLAPPNSFIHVDDFDSIKLLADYLIKLGNNDTLYGDYLRWMSIKEGLHASAKKDKVLDTFYPRFKNNKQNRFCEICEKLKKESSTTQQNQVIGHLDQWWFGENYSPSSDKFSVCSSQSGPSGSPKRWIVTTAYNLPFVILLLYWATSKCIFTRGKRRK